MALSLVLLSRVTVDVSIACTSVLSIAERKAVHGFLLHTTLTCPHTSEDLRWHECMGTLSAAVSDQRTVHMCRGSELERWLPDNTDGLPAKSSSPNSLLDGSDLFGPNTHVPSFTDELSDLGELEHFTPSHPSTPNECDVRQVSYNRSQQAIQICLA